MPDEHKTLEQRIADIEFSVRKLREEITNAYISALVKTELEGRVGRRLLSRV
jgi:hypothetical protein